MIPNLSGTVRRFTNPNPLKLLTIEKTTVDYEPVINRVEVDFKAVVQPANREKINPQIIDWSLRYIWIHSETEFLIGQYVLYKGIYYKILEDGYWSDY